MTSLEYKLKRFLNADILKPVRFNLSSGIDLAPILERHCARSKDIFVYHDRFAIKLPDMKSLKAFVELPNDITTKNNYIRQLQKKFNKPQVGLVPKYMIPKTKRRITCYSNMAAISRKTSVENTDSGS